MQTIAIGIFLSLSGAMNFQSQAENRQQQGQILSVCNLIAQRDKYDGKVVTVRGELKSGTEGSWLINATECDSRLVTKGVVWPNIVHLAYPNNRSSNPMDQADFAIDWGAEKRIGAWVLRSGFNPDRDHLIETFVGLFRTYPDLENRVSPNMQDGVRAGFGHLGAAPMQLLIKTRKDPSVVRRVRAPAEK